jgi:hypothetical protein
MAATIGGRCKSRAPGPGGTGTRQPARAAKEHEQTMRQATDLHPVIAVPRGVALTLVAVLNLATLAACEAGSYLGLYEWAAGHGLAGWRALVFPLAIDTFLIIGELTLFVAIIDGFADTKLAAFGVTLTALGLAASIAGNAGHAARAAVLDRLTWAAFPLAAGAALAAGLWLLHLIMAARRAQDDARELATAAHTPHARPRADVQAALTPARRSRPALAARDGSRPTGRAASRYDVPGVRAYLASLPADGLPSANRLAADQLGGRGVLGKGHRRLASELLAERRAAEGQAA